MAGVDILATAFNGANAAFIADMYARWVADPASVDESFSELFSALNDESRAVLTDAVGASWAPRHFRLDGGAQAPRVARSEAAGVPVEQAHAAIRELDPRPDAGARLPGARPS